jgi:hypothetical protein
MLRNVGPCHNDECLVCSKAFSTNKLFNLRYIDKSVQRHYFFNPRPFVAFSLFKHASKPM